MPIQLKDLSVGDRVHYRNGNDDLLVAGWTVSNKVICNNNCAYDIDLLERRQVTAENWEQCEYKKGKFIVYNPQMDRVEEIEELLITGVISGFYAIPLIKEKQAFLDAQKPKVYPDIVIYQSDKLFTIRRGSDDFSGLTLPLLIERLCIMVER